MNRGFYYTRNQRSFAEPPLSKTALDGYLRNWYNHQQLVFGIDNGSYQTLGMGRTQL